MPGPDDLSRRDTPKAREDPPAPAPPVGRGGEVPEVDDDATDVFAGMGAVGTGGPPVGKPSPASGRGPAVTPLARLAALEATVAALTIRVDAIAPIHAPPGPPDHKALTSPPVDPEV